MGILSLLRIFSRQNNLPWHERESTVHHSYLKPQHASQSPTNHHPDTSFLSPARRQSSAPVRPFVLVLRRAIAGRRRRSSPSPCYGEVYFLMALVPSTTIDGPLFAEVDMGGDSSSTTVRATVVQASTVFYDTPATLGMFWDIDLFVF